MSELSEQTDKTLQQQFYLQFQASRTSLATRLEACKTDATSQNIFQELALDIMKLGKSLTDATSFLPAYDQRQCREQIGLLEQALEEVRVASVPKTKFAFKRRTDKPNISPAPPLPPSPHRADELAGGDAVPSMSSFHKLSSHSNSRLSLRSIPTLVEEAQSFDLTISDLERCVVDLRVMAETAPRQKQTHLTAVHVRDLRDTILVLPNVKGSAILHGLHRCTVIVTCHQFRMHHSMNVRVYLAVMSNPVIENCSAIAFSDYPSFVSLSQPSSKDSESLPHNGKHTDVQDFSHIRPTPSPNWSLLAPGNENWDDLFASDDSSPQGLDAVLTAHLPNMMSANATSPPHQVQHD